MALDALATGDKFMWLMNGGSWYAQAEQPAAKFALEECWQLPGFWSCTVKTAYTLLLMPITRMMIISG